MAEPEPGVQIKTRQESKGLGQRCRSEKTTNQQLVVRKRTKRKNGQKTLCRLAPRLSFRKSWSF